MSSKQLFHHGDVVQVNVSPKKTWMSHFHTGFTAIVEGSYGDLYGQKGGGGGYSVYRLNEKGTKVINNISWYDAGDLKLIRKGTEKDFAMIRKFKYS